MTDTCRYLILIALVVGVSGSGMASDRVKHSGTILSISEDGVTFVLAEIGPGRGGAVSITYRTISITPNTEFAIVARADTAPSGFAGDFVELRIERQGLYPDDFVTVDCTHEGRRLVALKVTVTEPPVPEIGIGSLR